MIPIKLRPAQPDDINFILNSWLKVMRAEIPNNCPNEIFYRIHKERIMKTLQRALVTIAANPEDESQIFGYMVWEHPETIHFAFVKSPFRRLKIFQRLLDNVLGTKKFCTYTQHTWATNFFRRTLRLIYNPYMFYLGDAYENQTN